MRVTINFELLLIVRDAWFVLLELDEERKEEKETKERGKVAIARACFGNENVTRTGREGVGGGGDE